VLVTFKTNSYADITMFGDAGESLLKMMGQSGKVPGAIMASDVPAALRALKDSLAAVANGASSGGTPGSGTSSSAESSAAGDEQDGDAPPVMLSTRALPLVELLEAAIASSDNVLWDK
jgi:hypothetical protein